jgi:hypothetical protein
MNKTGIKGGWYLMVALVLALWTDVAMTQAAATVESNSVPGNMLLLDNMGRVVTVPTNEMPSALRPAADMKMEHQIPNPIAGSSMPLEIQQRAHATAPAHALSREPG